MKNNYSLLFVLAGLLLLGRLSILGNHIFSTINTSLVLPASQLALPYDPTADTVTPNDTSTIPLKKIPPAASDPAPTNNPTVPAAPSDLNYTASQITDIQLTWSDNSTDETGFVIEEKSTLSGIWSTFSTYDRPNDTTIVIDYQPLHFETGTTHTLRIRAINGVGQSDPSNEITFTIANPANDLPPQDSQADTQPPTVSIISPANGSSMTQGQTVLQAIATDDRGIAGVQFYIAGPGQNANFAELRNEDITDPYIIVGDFALGSYRAYVVARDTSNNYAPSNQISFTVVAAAYVPPRELPPDPTPPYVPPPSYQPPTQYYQPPVFNNDYSSFQNFQTDYTDYNTQNNAQSSPRPKTVAVKKVEKLNRNLKLKDQGEDVRLLQKMLNTLGYPVTDTGTGSPGHEGTTFDDKTVLALKAYQSSQAGTGLEQNGILDNATIFLIEHDYKTYLSHYDLEATSTKDTNVQGAFGRIRRGFDGFILQIKKVVLSYIP